MYRWLAVVSLVLGGCGSGDIVYCVAEVRAEDQDKGIEDPGFHNPDLVGETICWGDNVSQSFCNDRDGISGNLDDYENGPEEFCADQGYPVDCGGGLYMPTKEDCP